MPPQKAKAGAETRSPPASALDFAESAFAARANARAKPAKRDDIRAARSLQPERGVLIHSPPSHSRVGEMVCRPALQQKVKIYY